MRIIRKSTFETNSSSAHSLTFKREDIKNIPDFQGEYLVFDLSDYSNKFSGEPDRPEIHTDFKSRLAYLLCSVITYHSCDILQWVEVPNDYVKYSKLGAKEYDCLDYIKNLKRDSNGQWSDLFSHYNLSWYGRIYMVRLAEYLKDKVNLGEIDVIVQKEKYEYNLHWYNRKAEDRLQVIEYGEDKIVNIIDWESYSFNGIDYPIPIHLLYDLNWIENFLFNESTQVCISSTCNPLNTGLIQDWDNKEDGYSLYPDDKNNIRLINLVKDFNVVYNSSQLYINDKGLVGIKSNYSPF